MIFRVEGDCIMIFSDSSRGRNFSKDPAVVKFQGAYYLYYSLFDFQDSKSAMTGWSIGIAVSHDLETWEKAGEITPQMPCEKDGICAPEAIVINGKIHLFYQTYGSFIHDAICHAISADGINFIHNPTNPVFSPTGNWNMGRAIDADVVEHDGKLLLYFATRDITEKVQILGVASAPIDSSFSRGEWYQECNDSILTPQLPWEQQCIEAPAVCKHEGKLYMFYAGAYNNCPQQIGCAVSMDGVNWKRIFTEPFLPNGKSGEWNSSESGHPYIFKDEDERMYLFFQGNNDNGNTWYISKAEIGWNNGIPFLEKVDSGGKV